MIKTPGSEVPTAFTSEYLVGQYLQQIAAVSVFAVMLRQLFQLRGIDVAFAICDFFGAGDLQALPLLDRRDELAGIEQGLVRSRIEPCHASSHHFDVQHAFPEI